MATKRGKRPTKKVKSLKSKSLSAGKAKGVRGGSFSFGVRAQKLQGKLDDINFSRIYNK
jgi:hypothetical protein